ncbi:MAG: helix-turn-helix domain-containing protein [Caulobacteraceae bacterium]|nr:helix-turn-helix domain-containing protein [Caulobacteraceae bacterium]
MGFARNEEIYAQDEEADLFYRVVSGVVRTTHLTSDGRRHIGDFYYAGDVFGLDAGKTHRFSAEALTDCVVLVVRRAAVGRAADTDIALQRLIWTATCRELERTQAHLMLLGRRSACEKVASFLLEAANRAGGDLVTLPMGRQDMADYLGLTIETVSRMVTQLQSEGVVRFLDCRSFKVIRRPALEAMLA